MSFQVQRVFLIPHRHTSKTWLEIFGAQRYEIRMMDTFFRTDSPTEQVKESELLYLTGAYCKRFDSQIPIVSLPNTRILPVNSPMKVIGIVSADSKYVKETTHRCVHDYAKSIAKERKCEFIDLTQ